MAPDGGGIGYDQGKWVCRGSSSLYDLEGDPRERENVASAHPDLVCGMSKACKRIETDIKLNGRLPGMIARMSGASKRSVRQR